MLIIGSDSEKKQYEDVLNQYEIFVYTLSDGYVTLTDGTKGYIKPAGRDNIFTFEAPKYYYMPISEQDILINSNLVQNQFWK